MCVCVCVVGGGGGGGGGEEEVGREGEGRCGAVSMYCTLCGGSV